MGLFRSYRQLSVLVRVLGICSCSRNLKENFSESRDSEKNPKYYFLFLSARLTNFKKRERDGYQAERENREAITLGKRRRGIKT